VASVRVQQENDLGGIRAEQRPDIQLMRSGVGRGRKPWALDMRSQLGLGSPVHLAVPCDVWGADRQEVCSGDHLGSKPSTLEEGLNAERAEFNVW
jgi:hypothetical protein